MPWKTSAHQHRLNFVSLALFPQANLQALCRQFSISRPTAYKWLARYRSVGAQGLHELSRAPHRHPQKFRVLWQKELIALRRKHPSWGAKKLHVYLQQQHPRARQWPSVRTLGRWLKQAGLSAPQPLRHRPGPQVQRPALTQAQCCHEVWTIDFKGWFKTGDRQRCDPLTIRDLASRFLLCIRLVAKQSDGCVRRVMTGLFKTHGLPSVIRVDNGSPFAGCGALHLSSLSVWWLRLGIRVEFTRPAKPQDNGAHEQMHRLLKAETATPPAANPRAQQRRFDRWSYQYNHLRPHEALGGRVPARFYRRSPRPFHDPPPPVYPETWLTRRVRRNGWIKLEGVLRFIGRPFIHQWVGLQPASNRSWSIYLGTLLIGTLHRSDGTASMRAANFAEPKHRTKKKPKKAAAKSHV